MGMDFGDGPDFDAIREEREALKKGKTKIVKKEPEFISIGAVVFNNKRYLLLVGEDKKWYKCEYLKDVRVDPINNTPKLPVYDTKNIVPVTESEFYSYFSQTC